VKRLVKGILRRVGLDLVRTAPDAGPLTFDAAADGIIPRVTPYTMTSPERVNALIRAVRYVAEHDIPGAIVECGVWRGGSMMAAAETLIGLGRTDRDLYLFDTFEGMTEPGVADLKPNGKSAAATFQERRVVGTDGSDWCRASIEEVRANLQGTGYPAGRLHFVKGRVEDTIPSAAPPAIAVLRLDTDWYDSTRHELEHLFPKLAQGGVLIIDDYGAWMGARQATDEYLARTRRRILLHRIDGAGVIGVNCG
jgi:hypothetical protein